MDNTKKYSDINSAKRRLRNTIVFYNDEPTCVTEIYNEGTNFIAKAVNYKNINFSFNVEDPLLEVNISSPGYIVHGNSFVFIQKFPKRQQKSGLQLEECATTSYKENFIGLNSYYTLVNNGENLKKAFDNIYTDINTGIKKVLDENNDTIGFPFSSNYAISVGVKKSNSLLFLHRKGSVIGFLNTENKAITLFNKIGFKNKTYLTRKFSRYGWEIK